MASTACRYQAQLGEDGAAVPPRTHRVKSLENIDSGVAASEAIAPIKSALKKRCTAEATTGVRTEIQSALKAPTAPLANKPSSPSRPSSKSALKKPYVPPEAKPEPQSPKSRKSKDAGQCPLKANSGAFNRRPSNFLQPNSVFILNASDHDNLIGQIEEEPSSGAAKEALCPEPVEKKEVEIHPFAECMTAKKGKVDVDALRHIIEGVDDIDRWIEAPLDVALPSPLFFATAATLPAVVALLLEHGADVLKKYDGAKMYMGWIKPGMTPVEAVTSRKGRFLGTMLGDRLEEILGILKLAEDAMKALEETETKEVEKEKEAKPEEKKAGPRPSLHRAYTDLVIQKEKEPKVLSKKTIQMESAQGYIDHTQGDPSEKYDIISELEGVFSCVKLATHKESKQKRAIKCEMKVDEELIWEENAILRKIAHPSVIQLFETFEDAKYIYVVIEICSGGKLFNRLAEGGPVPEGAVSHIMHQCASAIHYIHSVNVAHRDIQPENFLLKDDGPLNDAQVKLIDFTMAKEFGEGIEMKTKICAVHYVAPEILTRKEVPYTEKVDVWSLGVVFFILLCGAPPFNGENELSILKKVKKGLYKFQPAEIWDNISSEAKDLIQAMLLVDSKARLSASDVISHGWLCRESQKSRWINKCEVTKDAGMTGLRNFHARDRFQKVVSHIGQQRLPDDAMKAMATIFRKLDKQKVGEVHISNIRDKMRRIPTLERYLEEIMRVLWSMHCNNGMVKFDKFVEAMIERQSTLLKEALKALFDVADLMGAGTITSAKLTKAILHGDASTSFKAGINTAFGIEADELEKAFPDGDLSFDAFFEIMQQQMRMQQAKNAKSTEGTDEVLLDDP